VFDVTSSAALYAIAQRWYWLVLSTVVGAAAAAGWAASQPLIYTASVDVVPQMRLVLAAPGLTPAYAGATAEHRQTLAQLVRSPDVERVVQDELGNTLPEALRAPGHLLPLVSGATAPRTEVITITAEAPDSALAGTMAAAWAKAYARKMSQVYGPDEVTVVNNSVIPVPKGKGTRTWGVRGAVVGVITGALAALAWPVTGAAQGGRAPLDRRSDSSAAPAVV